MIVIVMGVVGAGKTTVGRLLAEEVGWEFADQTTFTQRRMWKKFETVSRSTMTIGGHGWIAFALRSEIGSRGDAVLYWPAQP